MNLELGIMKKIKMVLIEPRRLFKEIAEEELKETIKYYLFLVSIPTIILFFWSILTIGISIGSLTTLLHIPLSLVALIIFSIPYHIGAKLLGGKKTWIHTIKIFVYGGTPLILIYPIFILLLLPYNISWFIPKSVVGGVFAVLVFIVVVWSIILDVIGFSEIHELTIIRAILAIIVSIVISLIILLVLSTVLLAVLLAIGFMMFLFG